MRLVHDSISSVCRAVSPPKVLGNSGNHKHKISKCSMGAPHEVRNAPVRPAHSLMFSVCRAVSPPKVLGNSVTRKYQISLCSMGAMFKTDTHLSGWCIPSCSATAGKIDCQRYWGVLCRQTLSQVTTMRAHFKMDTYRSGSCIPPCPSPSRK